MFCTNCGKQIIDTAKFCNYCGAVTVANADATAPPVQTPMAQSVAVTVPEAVDLPKEGVAPVVADVAPSAQPVQSAETADTTATVQTAQPTSATPIAPTQQAQPVAPTSPVNTAPTESTSTTAPHTLPQPLTAKPAPTRIPAPIPLPTPKIEREPRMYTAGHIIMCLASTAIMAIVAGIFAGLYFSVV